MTLSMVALIAIGAVAIYFLARIARCLEADFNLKLALQESQENQRQHRREQAKKGLKRATEELADPRFKETDYALGTGHGYRRDERILSAKTWEEVEAIVFGEDLETEKDRLNYWQSVEQREGKGSV
jgi:hypothetical protein